MCLSERASLDNKRYWIEDLVIASGDVAHEKLLISNGRVNVRVLVLDNELT